MPLANRTAPPDRAGLDKPYAYFSSGTRSNGYNAYVGIGSDCLSLATPQAILPSPYNGWPTPPGPPLAYAQNTGQPTYQYYKADTFQIISAGKDRVFGPGLYWVPSMGASGMSNAGAAPGVDDLTNFYDSKLGVTP
jgi:hypothetical protein